MLLGRQLLRRDLTLLLLFIWRLANLFNISLCLLVCSLLVCCSCSRWQINCSVCSTTRSVKFRWTILKTDNCCCSCCTEYTYVITITKGGKLTKNYIIIILSHAKCFQEIECTICWCARSILRQHCNQEHVHVNALPSLILSTMCHEFLALLS